MSAFEPRSICPTCRRPEVVCYCRFVSTIATRTRVVILQHPRERDVPINTARIASLCLPDADVRVGVRWTSLDDVTGDPERPAALLYPGPGAIDVEANPPRGPITLVVIDGTWAQARQLVRKNPAIASLPRYAFRPEAASDYRIRREPHADYVSTIEALAHVLGVLEGDRDRFAPMLRPFRAMVDAQLAYAARGTGSRHAPKARRRFDPRTRIPLVFRDRARDLVCVYGEANAWPYEATERGECPDELVHWVACRIATGETFDSVLAPRRALCPATPFHVQVDRDALVGGESVEACLARWSRFFRPTDLMCGWGHYATALFGRAGGELPKDRIDVRTAAREFASARVGTMDAFCTKIGAEIPSPRTSGRAGVRLATLEAIARFFVDHSSEVERSGASAAVDAGSVTRAEVRPSEVSIRSDPP